MILAVTGGTGFVGQAVLDEAARRKMAVRALTRKPQAAREGITWITGDLAATDALKELVSGADAVLHIAGVVNAPDVKGFEEGNVTGTRNVCDAALKAGIGHFVHVSSLAAREPMLSHYGHSKRMAEEVVQVSGLDWTIVRPPAVYGPRDTEILELFKAARWRLLPMPPKGRTSVIHAFDLSRLLLDLAAARDMARGRIFEPDDGREHGWSHTEFAQAIGEAVGYRVWAPNIPAGLLRLAARMDRQFRGYKAKLTPDRASYMAHPDWVSSAEKRVPPDIWQPSIETQAGLRETAGWYRANGWLP